MEINSSFNCNEFLNILEPSVIKINQSLEQTLSIQTNSETSEAMRYAVLGGGKRIRGFLVLESCKLFDIKEEYAVQAASAIECMHSYSLIHDDLPSMDNDDFRRGKPTIHKKWNEPTAILAGDALQSLCYQILSHTKTHPDPLVRINLISSLSVASGIFGMVEGQALDIEGKIHFDNDNLNFISNLQKLKTGALIKWSSLVGPVMNNSEIETLTKFSDCLGLAFQIKDDILDLEGNEKEIGKKIQKDSQAGKITFVSVLGLQKAKEKAKELIDEACSSLDIYGDKANKLKLLANFIINRNF